MLILIENECAFAVSSVMTMKKLFIKTVWSSISLSKKLVFYYSSSVAWKWIPAHIKRLGILIYVMPWSSKRREVDNVIVIL